MTTDAYAGEEDPLADTTDRCLHEACTCECGHATCAGMIGRAETAVG